MDILYYKLHFSHKEFLVYLQIKVCRIFGRFLVLVYFEYHDFIQVLGMCAEKSRPIQGYVAVVICLTSELGRDNFNGIRAVNF